MRAVLCLSLVTALAHGQDHGAVDRAIEKGVDWLLATQALDGSWRGYNTKSPTGVTALCVYTLLKCGLPPDHPAVTRGFAFVQAFPVERTYTTGATLMACHALGPKHRPVAFVKQLTKQLVATLQRTGWGYPSNATGENPVYADTSNSQYALLGLQAAAAMDAPVSKTTWRNAADALIRRQGRSGGFGYQRSERPTGAMTVAGLASLVICSKALPPRGGLQPKLKVARRRADAWLQSNWSMTRNVAFPKATKETDRWLLYHLYGVERLAAFLGKVKIGGHDWYAEGVPVVLKSQKKDGSWQRVMREADSCFALLFLRQGSRVTGLAPRVRVQRGVAAKSPFAIGMDGAHPVKAWVRKGGAELRRRIEAGKTPVQLTWTIDDEVIRTVKLTPDATIEDQVLEWRSERNGIRRISAVLKLADSSGKVEELRSNVLELKIDNVPALGTEEIVKDLGKNLIDRDDTVVDASSHSQWTRPEHVVDGTHARAWLAAPDDGTPWVRVRFERPVRARELVLTSARSPRERDDHLARPKGIEVSFGGRKKRVVTLDDTVRKQHTITFPARSVREVRVRIVSRYPGKVNSPGFAEVELRR